MGKIYENDVKLNVVQVCGKLSNQLTLEQADLLVSKFVHIDMQRFPRKAVAHAILDAYKEFPAETDLDAENKKLCKHLMDKYMKSTVSSSEDESAHTMLIEKITRLVEGHE